MSRNIAAADVRTHFTELMPQVLAIFHPGNLFCKSLSQETETSFAPFKAINSTAESGMKFMKHTLLLICYML